MRAYTKWWLCTFVNIFQKESHIHSTFAHTRIDQATSTRWQGSLNGIQFVQRQWCQSTHEHTRGTQWKICISTFYLLFYLSRHAMCNNNKRIDRIRRTESSTLRLIYARVVGPDCVNKIKKYDGLMINKQDKIQTQGQQTESQCDERLLFLSL